MTIIPYCKPIISYYVSYFKSIFPITNRFRRKSALRKKPRERAKLIKDISSVIKGTDIIEKGLSR